MGNGNDAYKDFMMDRYGARRRELEETVELLTQQIVDINLKHASKDARIVALQAEVDMLKSKCNCSNEDKYDHVV